MQLARVGRVSLLDQPRDWVELRPEVESVDEFGTPTRVPGPPVSVGGRMQPAQFSEGSTSRGLDVSTSAVLGAITYYQFITRSLPPGAWSTLTWQGRVFDVMGEVRRSNGSDLTRHDSIMCRAQQPEVIP